MFCRYRALWIASLIMLMVAVAAPSALSQTATDIPMWFDVSSSTPPNIKLNQDFTSELQNEEQVAVDPTNPDNLVAVWRDFRLSYRQCGWGYSHDGGTSWTEGGLIAETPYNRDSDPGIVANSAGDFYAVILSFDEFSEANGLFVPVSFDKGETWFAYLDGIDTPTFYFEDKELLAVDNTGGPSDGNLYVAWTRFGSTQDIYCITSTDGVSFGPLHLVSDGGGVQWPVPVVRNDGAVVIAWYSYAHSAIRCDISTDEGTTWGTDRTVAQTTFFPSSINGSILVFPFPALASDITGGTYDGRLYCTFSDFAADGYLDLYFTMSTDGGSTWTPRKRINDDLLGNMRDQFHPWTSVNKDGVVTVAWYDRRLDPLNVQFDLYVSHSFDGGVTWTPNQRVSNVSSSPANALPYGKSQPEFQPVEPDIPLEIQSPQAGLIGEYIGLATSERRATMVFTDTRNGNQDVYAANMPLRLFPPRLTGPSDGLITTDPNVTFTWEDYSIYETALTYVLEYSEDQTFTTGVTRMGGITSHSQNLTLPDGSFYWRVRAFDTFGDSSDVDMRTVLVDATPPVPPVPLAPFDGDTITDPTPTIAWSEPPGETVPPTYNLEIASDPGFSADVRSYPNLNSASHVVPDEDILGFDQFWYWHVSAMDDAGNGSAFSPTQQFYLELPYLIGDLDDDGFLTSLDMGILIDFLFAGQPLPFPPPERADLNCDGFPDSLDLGEMIDHLFAGHPAPSCP